MTIDFGTKYEVLSSGTAITLSSVVAATGDGIELHLIHLAALTVDPSWGASGMTRRGTTKNPFSSWNTDLWTLQGVTGATSNITATQASSTNYKAWAWPVESTGNDPEYEDHAESEGTTTTTTLTPTSSNPGLIGGFVVTNQASAITGGGSQTTEDEESVGGNQTENSSIQTTGSESLTWSWGSATHSAHSVSWKEAAAGGATIPIFEYGYRRRRQVMN